MTDENKNSENKNLKNGLIIGWIFFFALFIGRAVAILLTHDDVANFREFVDRLGILDFFYVLVVILLTSGSIMVFKKK